MENKVLRQVANNKTFLVQEEPRGPSQLIEIPVTANGISKVVIPDQPNLRNQIDQKIIIKALRVIPDTVLTNAPQDGNANATLAELQKCSLILYCEGWEKGQNIPLLTLVDTFTEASGIPWHNRTMQFANWENVDWNKSSIVYANGTGGSAGQPYTFVLEVEYVKIDKDGNEIVGPS